MFPTHHVLMQYIQFMLISELFVVVLEQGAQRHHAPSMLYLGKMCLYGQGFPIDYDMALVWFEKAADKARKFSSGFPTAGGVTREPFHRNRCSTLSVVISVHHLPFRVYESYTYFTPNRNIR